MFNQLSRNWQLLALLGILTIVWPGVTLYALTLLFGAYILAKGLLGMSATLTDMAALRRCWIPVRIRRPFDR
jgi:uncharacterized membrane protein HdeD (DUF308 family)